MKFLTPLLFATLALSAAVADNAAPQPSPPTGADGKPLPPPTGADGKPLPPPTGADGKPLPPPGGMPPNGTAGSHNGTDIEPAPGGNGTAGSHGPPLISGNPSNATGGSAGGASGGNGTAKAPAKAGGATKSNSNVSSKAGSKAAGSKGGSSAASPLQALGMTVVVVVATVFSMC